ncbi:MAG TPA: 3-deoxy-manno-octulosonate cytidylyltransferase [Isosphaeraceae bacterium]|nr:3-deoxy-manno-octulosonate cytidylyltransferase [Isosphaeraceae bacterium]
MGNAQIVGVIPARFASTRLPGKPLLSATGRPLIQHVVEAARRAQSLERILVATDDPRIAEAVTGFGGEAVMTRADHATGTDRVAEVAAGLDGTRLIVNLQGDEPEVSAAALDRVVALLAEDPEAPMATLATPIRDQATYRDPACVKVVCTRGGRALYFSRSPIPCYRDGLAQAASSRQPLAYLHLGLYAYRREFLLAIGSLPRSALESAEKLEQLRVLDAGYPIAVGIVDEPSIGIDTPEDYQRFVERWQARQVANPLENRAGRSVQ